MVVFESWLILDGLQLVFRHGDSGGEIAGLGRLANADHRQLHSAQTVIGVPRVVFEKRLILLDGLRVIAGFQCGVGLRKNIITRLTE